MAESFFIITNALSIISGVALYPYNLTIIRHKQYSYGKIYYQRGTCNLESRDSPTRVQRISRHKKCCGNILPHRGYTLGYRTEGTCHRAAFNLHLPYRASIHSTTSTKTVGSATTSSQLLRFRRSWQNTCRSFRGNATPGWRAKQCPKVRFPPCITRQRDDNRLVRVSHLAVAISSSTGSADCRRHGYNRPAVLVAGCRLL